MHLDSPGVLKMRIEGMPENRRGHKFKDFINTFTLDSTMQGDGQLVSELLR